MKWGVDIMTVKELETAIIDIIYSKYPPYHVTHYTTHYYVQFNDIRTGKPRRIHCRNIERVILIYNKYKPLNYTYGFDIWLYLDIYRRFPSTCYVECRPYKHESVRITDEFKKCKGVCKHK